MGSGGDCRENPVRKSTKLLTETGVSRDSAYLRAPIIQRHPRHALVSATAPYSLTFMTTVCCASWLQVTRFDRVSRHI